ncbi:Sucrose-6F-phosphate phosphohydrolase [Cryptosporidium felis]|nr:Sucrose-6F-phosphate phosphohydrolase [Cryptosporidium felis]
MVRVQLFYNSGWEKVFYYSDEQEAAGEEAKWVFREMSHVEKNLNWHSIDFVTRRAFLEFVLCNQEKSEWDNPPDSCNCRNYRVGIEVNKDEPSNGEIKELRFCLKDGNITRVPSITPIVIVTDLDGTLLGKDEYLEEFNDIWIRQHMFNGSKLIYSTGRNLKDFLLAAKKFGLLKPDYAICGVGTEIYEFPGKAMNLEDSFEKLRVITGRKINHSDLGYSGIEIQDRGDGGSRLDLENIREEANPQFPDWCKNRFFAWPIEKWLQAIKKSFDRDSARAEVEEILNRDNLKYYINGNNFHDPFRLSISIDSECALKAFQQMQKSKKSYRFALSGQGEWRYLDILPEKGGKDLSILFLHDELLNSIPSDRFLVCGDSGNDAHMFSIEAFRSCCVGNAQQDLKDFLLGGCQISKDKAGPKQGSSERSELLCKIMESQGLKPPKSVSSSKDNKSK